MTTRVFFTLTHWIESPGETGQGERTPVRTIILSDTHCSVLPEPVPSVPSVPSEPVPVKISLDTLRGLYTALEDIDSILLDLSVLSKQWAALEEQAVPLEQQQEQKGA